GLAGAQSRTVPGNGTRSSEAGRNPPADSGTAHRRTLLEVKQLRWSRRALARRRPQGRRSTMARRPLNAVDRFSETEEARLRSRNPHAELWPVHRPAVRARLR